MTSCLLDVRVGIGLEKFRSEGEPSRNPGGFVLGQEGRLDPLVGVSFEQVEYESKFGVIIVIGSMTSGEDLVTLEDEFFRQALVAFEGSRRIDLGFFGRWGCDDRS
jgi:hypothetical protein